MFYWLWRPLDRAIRLLIERMTERVAYYRSTFEECIYVHVVINNSVSFQEDLFSICACSTPRYSKYNFSRNSVNICNSLVTNTPPEVYNDDSIVSPHSTTRKETTQNKNTNTPHRVIKMWKHPRGRSDKEPPFFGLYTIEVKISYVLYKEKKIRD